MTQPSGSLEQRLFSLEPQYHERVWGGQRLRAATPPVGEAWVAGEGSRVTAGPHAGASVGELSAQYPAALLGEAARLGGRFPLLIKLLDCADWLSVQVHPNDDQARRMVGPGEFGKTEAWHFLEVEPGAAILAGVTPGTTPDELRRAILAGKVMEVSQRQEPRAGETLFIPAGTLHALGPGLLLYEVQQTSDTTYRVYDWDRPASAGRQLHLQESAEVTDAHAQARLTPPPAPGQAEFRAVTCPFFGLDVLALQEGAALRGDPAGQSPHLLTVVEGEVSVTCGDEELHLGLYDTALVSAGAGGYELRTSGAARVLRAGVPTGA
ncbi:type I phosphomannose isomerase catalytic subunit [Deinococcus sp. Leaf326]|uniref:type I phosphomannose isomerase catalytic subunit n=1 Tax=Deinococcus sp. Leaf326 TaxID=1736338 RepID=UPI000700AB69|nr:type I phosphomannose isomerase catalytic subunit [Deinococcus sp. Leaf326]KQR22768.1 mannose-6-phosphate isomerase [Deinococcus sp. Leaf326]